VTGGGHHNWQLTDDGIPRIVCNTLAVAGIYLVVARKQKNYCVDKAGGLVMSCNHE